MRLFGVTAAALGRISSLLTGSLQDFLFVFLVRLSSPTQPRRVSEKAFAVIALTLLELQDGTAS